MRFLLVVQVSINRIFEENIDEMHEMADQLAREEKAQEMQEVLEELETNVSTLRDLLEELRGLIV